MITNKLIIRLDLVRFAKTLLFNYFRNHFQSQDGQIRKQNILQLDMQNNEQIVINLKQSGERIATMIDLVYDSNRLGL